MFIRCEPRYNIIYSMHKWLWNWIKNNFKNRFNDSNFLLPCFTQYTSNFFVLLVVVWLSAPVQMSADKVVCEMNYCVFSRCKTASSPMYFISWLLWWFVIVGCALLKRGTVPHMFMISHFQGTNPVQYNVSGWLKACRENPVSRSASTVLQESKWYIHVTTYCCS